MNKTIMKNIPQKTILSLADQIDCLPGQVVSKTLAQNAYVSLTLFAFDKDEEISTHKSEGDAKVTALYGKGKITIEEEEFILNEGESIIMPANKAHSVYAVEPFKMFLAVVF